MRVIAYQRGRINKVVFDGCEPKGWFAYIDPPAEEPATR